MLETTDSMFHMDELCILPFNHQCWQAKSSTTLSLSFLTQLIKSKVLFIISKFKVYSAT